jgi:cytochrome c-type biogenesis protein
MGNISLVLAFIAGFMSFFSPCVLPMVPSFILYIAGFTFRDVQTREDLTEIRIKSVTSSLFFILGFSIVFMALGLTASLLGQALFRHKDAIRVIGGIIVMLLGLYLMGVLKVPFLDLEKRLNLRSKPVGYSGAFIMGVTFSAAWTPCAGPILGSILVLAAASGTFYKGLALLVFYSAGLALPFLLASLSVNLALSFIRRTERIIRVITFASGLFIFVIGLLMTVGFRAIV